MNAAADSSGEMLLSIVVPVFNVARYLREGLESLLRQDFDDPYEVILIDDCSTDEECGTGLCDENGFCAEPIDTTDGQACVDDTNCPTGDNCDTSTGSCFSDLFDGTGGGDACTSDSDCSGDETCDQSSGQCVG